MSMPIYMTEIYDKDVRVFRQACEMLDRAGQEELKEAALNAPSIGVRREAVRRLTDQDALAEVAVKNSAAIIRAAAADKLNDQDVLAHIAEHDTYHRTRAAAARRLTDQKALARVAEFDSETDVRRAAVENMTDQKALADVAIGDSEHIVRSGAVRRLTGQAELGRVALKAQDELIRFAAIEKLTDQKVLADVARRESGEGLGAVAAGRLTDQDVLAQLAMHDSSALVRMVAVKKLNDPRLLTRIAYDNTPETVRDYELINKKLPRGSHIVRCVYSGKGSDAQACAARKLLSGMIPELPGWESCRPFFRALDKLCSRPGWVKELPDTTLELVLICLKPADNYIEAISRDAADALLDLYRSGRAQKMILLHSVEIITKKVNISCHDKHADDDRTKEVWSECDSVFLSDEL